MDTWKMANGCNIRIADMTDQHVVNTYKYLLRKADEDISDYPFFGGEMAQYYAEGAYDSVNEENERYIRRFSVEIRNRNLTL